MEYKIKTNKSDEMIDITSQIRQHVKASGVKDGIAVVFVAHTSAGVTINENADDDVFDDILNNLDRLFPKINGYKHKDGNSYAHLKASMIGSSSTVIIENGELLIGEWQGIYFCEFEGPRERKFYVKLIEGANKI